MFPKAKVVPIVEGSNDLEIQGAYLEDHSALPENWTDEKIMRVVVVNLAHSMDPDVTRVLRGLLDVAKNEGMKKYIQLAIEEQDMWSE